MFRDQRELRETQEGAVVTASRLAAKQAKARAHLAANQRREEAEAARRVLAEESREDHGPQSQHNTETNTGAPDDPTEVEA